MRNAFTYGMMALDVFAVLMAAWWCGEKIARGAWWARRFAAAGVVGKALAVLGIAVAIVVVLAAVGLAVFVVGLTLDPRFMRHGGSAQAGILVLLAGIGGPVVLGGAILVSEILLLPLGRAPQETPR